MVCRYFPHWSFAARKKADPGDLVWAEAPLGIPAFAPLRRFCGMLFGLTLALATTANLSWAQAGGRIWSGTGHILSGQGQGATVQLVIEQRNGRLQTQSGPPLDVPFSGRPETIDSNGAKWQIEPQGDQMAVTLYRGDQIIRYLLRPAPGGSNFQGPVQLAPNGQLQIPAVPVVQELIVTPRQPSPQILNP